MKFLKVDEVVAMASTTIMSTTREDRQVIGSWIWMAEKQIESFKLNTKTDELSVIGLVANKPEDFVKIQELSLIDVCGNDVRYRYRSWNGKRIHETTELNNQRLIDVYEDQTCFHLSSNGSDICKINIRYSSLPIDEDGYLLIPETHLYPLIMFVKYMDSLRKGTSISLTMELMREWKIQAAKARGRDSMPSMPEAREIFAKWNTLIAKGSKEKYSTY